MSSVRLSALRHVLGLAVVAIPAVVVACTTEVTDATPSPATSSTEPNTPAPSSSPAPTPTTTSTSPPKDAGPDSAKDAAPPPTDIIGSAECTAYCDKMKTKCNRTCIPKQDCAIEAGQCAASAQDFLDCQTTTGQWFCGADGFSIVHSCKKNASLCN